MENMKIKKLVKEFYLGAVKWCVKVDNDKLNDREAYGTSDYNTSTILLQEKSRGHSRETSAVQQTLYHEVVHAILFTLGEYELGENEKFVQQFSLLIHQFENTKK